MRLITNWRNATVADSEADALLDEATKLHVVSYQMQQGKSGDIKGGDKDIIKKFLQYHVDNAIPLVMHNGICFDVPLFEKLLGIKLDGLMLIDTMALSWYLNTERKVHGLDSFLSDYGIEKPKIDDWEGLTYEKYRNRCSEDVKINKALWEDFKYRLTEMYAEVKRLVDAKLVGGTRTSSEEEIYLDRYINNSTVDQYIDRVLTFLMHKMSITRLKEETKCIMDKPALQGLGGELGGLLEAAKEELEVLMPPVPIYGSTKNKPKKPFKKDGTPSAHGISWDDALSKIGKVDDNGTPIAEWKEEGEAIKILTGYDNANIGSVSQVKSFLFSHGWVPRSFKFVKDKDAMNAWADSGFKKHLKPKARMVPQISIDGESGKELCESVQELAEDVPSIRVLARYGLIKNRRDTVKGFLERMGDGDTLRAGTGGFTNTLREKHRGVVNLPGVGKAYGKGIRGAFIAKKGYILEGSDLNSLEDRVKHHFMLPHDPEYVATMMAEDYDPHILMALTAKMIDQQQFDAFKGGNKSPDVAIARSAGKQTNYAAVYNSGAETLSQSCGLPVSKCKELLDAYWKLNWSVKKIAEEQVVFKDSLGNKWLVNPVNGFCYSLRKDSDRFSTLCQGTGSFFFDMWVDNVVELMYTTFGVKRISLLMHDEFMCMFKDTIGNRDKMAKITHDSIKMVNDEYLLRRPLGCDVQFGRRYSDIH